MNSCIIECAILDIARNKYHYLMNLPNVRGIGYGYKFKNGICTFKQCIQVLVERKLNKNNLNYSYLVPSIFMGIETDVIQIGAPKAYGLNSRIRPLDWGYSICADVAKSLKGTIGAIVTKGTLIKDYYILSNNHVLAGENSYAYGTKIIQPSFSGGGVPGRDYVAKLSASRDLEFETKFSKKENIMDAAIAKLNKASLASKVIASGVGKVKGVQKAELGMEILKVGCVTGLTRGKIVTLGATLDVDFSDGKSAFFVDQIATNRIAEAGDSGSLLINKNKYALGLLVSGTPSYSVFCDISEVLKYFGVSLFM